MSILTHRNHTKPRFGSGGQRTHAQSVLQAIFAFIRSVVFRAGKLVVGAAEAIAEARMRRATLEAELYLNRHSAATSPKGSQNCNVVLPRERNQTSRQMG